MGRASRRRRERSELRAAGLLPEPEPARQAPAKAVVNEPNRKAFLGYSLALLVLWVLGLSLFPQSLSHQMAAMVGAWLLSTAGAVLFRLRRDGSAWLAPFLRRAVPLGLLAAAVGGVVWTVAPMFGPRVGIIAQGVVPGLLVALLMVGTGRMMFPLQEQGSR